MYKIASKKGQGRSERIGIRDMPATEERITDEQRYTMLLDGLQRLEIQLKSLPRNHPERKQLGRQKFVLQNEMRAVRGRTRLVNLGQCFIDAARLLLTREQYDQVMAEAKRISVIRYKAEIEQAERVRAMNEGRQLAD